MFCHVFNTYTRHWLEWWLLHTFSYKKHTYQYVPNKQHKQDTTDISIQQSEQQSDTGGALNYLASKNVPSIPGHFSKLNSLMLDQRVVSVPNMMIYLYDFHVFGISPLFSGFLFLHTFFYQKFTYQYVQYNQHKQKTKVISILQRKKHN